MSREHDVVTLSGVEYDALLSEAEEAARLREELAALRAAPAAEPVAVKPLEWRNGCASTSIGNYLVVEEDWDEDPFWFVIFNGKPLNKLGVHRSEAEAISAAQDDYERRIRESLVAAAPTEAGR